MVKIKEEVTFALEGNTPLFILNKDVVLDKFHSILKDRVENNPNSHDIAHIARSIIAKDRKILHQEIYLEINQ